MIVDDFDLDDELNGVKEVSLISTKLVVGQHIQLLAERLVLNQKVGRLADEIICVQDMIGTLTSYLEVLQTPGDLNEEGLKRKLAKIYESSTLLTPEELAKQLDEIRSKSGLSLDEDKDTGID